MFRMTRVADYGVVLLTAMARKTDRHRAFSAKELAAETHLPDAIASKVLKTLARSDLLESHRGAHGGYSLAKAPGEITVAEIVNALEGPIAITDCSSAEASCDLEILCRARPSLQQINLVVQEALEGITLADMIRPRVRETAPAAALESAPVGA